jgi:hypothetical protein
VYRAPLPYAALASAARAQPLAPTLRLLVLRVLNSPVSDAAAEAAQLAQRVAAGLGEAAAQGAPLERFVVSAMVATPNGCGEAEASRADSSAAAAPPPAPAWQCEIAHAARELSELSDRELDAWLHVRAPSCACAVRPRPTDTCIRCGAQARGGSDAHAGAYTLVLLPGGDGACEPASATAAAAAPVVSVTYGMHRHAWARCAGVDAVAAARVAARRLGELAAPGAAAPPLSADGALRLEFALCNAAPQAGHHFSWDFAAAEARFIAPMAAALSPLATLRVGSSVLLHTPLGAGVEPVWDSARRAHVLPAAALSQLVDPEWPLHAPGGAPQERVLQLLAYVPPAALCPLALPHAAPGFTSPGWGGVVLWNSAGCDGALNATRRSAAVTPPRELSGAEMRSLMALFAAQLRTLLGLPPTPGADVVPAASAAFAAWEVDALARRAAAAHAAAAAESLAALGRVVRALPDMVISDTIAALAARGLRAAAEATRATAAGQHVDATAAADAAHAAAEGAFFHPSILSLLYFPSDHKLAVYLPLFLPALLPLVLAAMREGRHYRRRRAFAAAFCALAKKE